jgi:hypothetical protein
MLKRYALGIFSLAITLGAQAQVFTNASAVLSNNSSGAACVGVSDMDGDGLDDIIQLDDSKHVYVLYQNPDHSFVTFDYGVVDNSNQWGWAIADLNNDGHKDICSGVNTTRFVSITARGVFTLSDLPGPSIFTQCMTMADWNNDGKVDLFACNDVGPSNIYITDANGVPVYTANVMPWVTPACTGTAGDMSGNYGSTATDFDNDGDIDLHISHCRQGVNDPNDCRRWDRLFVNDGNGNYADMADVYGLQNKEQVWTTDFGDIDNDGDLDAFSTTHSTTLMLFLNDGAGYYTNATAGSGLETTSGFFLQGKMEDMDNDGFIDIMTGSAEHFFHNNAGNGTFTEVTGLFPAAKDMHSMAFGEMNGDGFPDVYATYGDGYVDGDPGFPDRLWLNTPNGNHYLNVRMEGVTSNRDAVGGRITIIGPWGTQIREVHAGESYGIVNTTTLHFGLGAETVIPTMIVTWPSGQVDTYTNVPADQFITVLEGVCISPVASISTSGAPVVCTGGAPLALNANPGFNYLWSTGATTQSINVSAGGTYSVIIDDGQGCTGQRSIMIAQDPDETPSVAASGETTICELDEVTLTSSTASSYLWSTGATTQSITVNAPDNYAVTVNGTCGSYTSDAVVVDVLAAAPAPGANNVNIPVAGTADLDATGDNISWYDVALGGTAVGSGNTWTTPFLSSNTTYWAEAAQQYGGTAFYGGRTVNATPGAYHSNPDNYLLFEAYEDFVLKSVKVYANGAGNRTIGLTDFNQGIVLQQITVNIPDGESRVQLDFNVPAGGPYGLRVIGGNPQLWRDANGSNPVFPYALGTLGAVTSTTVSAPNTLNFYYFFYDWEVREPLVLCAGPRTEVDVTVGPVGVAELAGAQDLRVYPNPTDALLTIAFDATQGDVRVELMDITGRVVLDRRASAAAGRMDLDVSPLAAGDYTIRVQRGDRISVQRVVVR